MNKVDPAISHGRQPRPYGQARGDFEVPTDFDAPLPDDVLREFEGVRSYSMPARDRYHDQVKNALIKDGWTITNDPLHLKWGKKDMYVDLGAERLLAAEKADRRIAIEVKGFLGPSEMVDLERAVGQYVIYSGVMRDVDPNRVLYLAVTEEIYEDLFEEPIG